MTEKPKIKYPEAADAEMKEWRESISHDRPSTPEEVEQAKRGIERIDLEDE